MLIDYFFSKENCNEEEFGIIENRDIPLSVWKDALDVFEDKNLKGFSVAGSGSDA